MSASFSTRRAGALLRKELRMIFGQPLLFVVGAVFLLLVGYYFYSDLLFFVSFALGQTIFESFFRLFFVDMRLVLLIAVPLLTMRTLAEERKLGTIELLFTYPLSDLEILAAKLTAVFLAILALVGVTLVHPAWLYTMQSYAVAPVAAGYLGVLLLAFSFAAVGVFLSSLTDNQVVAAMSTMGVLLLLWTLSWNEAAPSASTLAWLQRLSMFDHFEGFARGVIETRDLIYFLSLIALAVLAALASLGSRAWQSGRIAPTLIGFAGLAVAIGFVDLIADRHNYRFDLTAAQRYTLSPHARRILERLPQDVELTAFVRSGDPRSDTTADLLARIAEASPRVQTRVVDLHRNPALAKRYGVDAFGATVIESGGRHRIVARAREEVVVGAMLSLARPRPLVIGLALPPRPAGGGSDGRAFTTLTDALDDSGYEVRQVETGGEIPPDVDLLIAVSDDRKNADEAPAGNDWPALSSFMDRGGRLLALIEPDSAGPLMRYVTKEGIAPAGDVVIDPESRLYAGESVSIVAQPPTAAPTPRASASAALIAETLSDGVVLSLARSLDLTSDAVPLLESGPQSWSTVERERAERGFATFAAGDRRGPLVVAAAREWPVADGRSARMVVVGDSDLASNAFVELLANRDLIGSAVSWLAGEEDLIALRPRRKQTGREQLLLSAGQARFALVFGVFVLPMLSALVAAGMALRRQWRR